MLTFFIAISINLCLAFLLMYAFDKAELWKTEDERIHLYQPRIDDLNTDDKYVISEYVTDVICPSYYYFILLDEIQGQQKNISPTGCLWIGMVLQLPSILLAYRGIMSLEIFDNPLLRIGIIIVILSLGSFVLWKVYGRTHKLESFSKNKSALSKDFDNLRPYQDYEISNQAAFNNYVIDVHLRYLLSIRKSCHARAVIRNVITALVLIVFLLFVPFNP